MAGLYPPPFLNTEEDRGAIVAVVAFTSVAVSTLANTIRIWIRQQAKPALGLDDALLVAANVSYPAARQSEKMLLTDLLSTGNCHCPDHCGGRQHQAWSWTPLRCFERRIDRSIP